LFFACVFLIKATKRIQILPLHKVLAARPEGLKRRFYGDHVIKVQLPPSSHMLPPWIKVGADSSKI